jgi:folate-dependent phosphoribosylglycinamide formyltransferase PurN
MLSKGEIINKKWYCFCSQTGSEIVNLSKLINKTPVSIITNNYKKLSQSSIDYFQSNNIEIITLPFNPTLEDYQNLNIDKDSLITLHGYLRILPKEYCYEYSFLYNGHPGLITEYFDLKGKDPQVKAFEKKYTKIGSVVHKVTPEVDEGQIITYDYTTINPNSSIDEYYNALKLTSINAWKKFFTL